MRAFKKEGKGRSSSSYLCSHLFPPSMSSSSFQPRKRFCLFLDGWTKKLSSYHLASFFVKSDPNGPTFPAAFCANKYFKTNKLSEKFLLCLCVLLRSHFTQTHTHTPNHQISEWERGPGDPTPIPYYSVAAFPRLAANPSLSLFLSPHSEIS